MTEWFYEAGIGEDRAIQVAGSEIVEARIERHEGIKPGLVTNAQLLTRVVANTRGIVRLEDGHEALLSPLPKGLDEGASLVVEVTRGAIDEKSRLKLPQVRAAHDSTLRAAPSLLEQITQSGIAVRHCRAHERDYFEEHGWSEVLEEARSGIVRFAGGSLHIALTPAMTLIDVDGDMKAGDLALSAAEASAHAIRRHNIQGNIGIDFPAVEDKAVRNAVAEAFDRAMEISCERTAINGFGFMQIVTRRTKQSLLEVLQNRGLIAYVLELARRAERDKDAAPMRLVAHPAIISQFEKRPDWTRELAKRTGRAVCFRADAGLSMGGGYVEPTT